MSMGRWRSIVGVVLMSSASVALGDAFFGANPQPGSLTFSGFSDGSVSATITGGSFPNVLAGQFQGFFDPAAEADGPGHEPDDFLRFFCIDINHLANAGPNPYTRDLGVPDATNAAQLARLFDLYYPDKTIGTYYSGGAVTTFGDFADATTSAAFQLAVWEIWFDNDMNLSTGTFTATSAAKTLAQSYLDAVNAGSGTPPGWTFYTFTSNVSRDHPNQYQEYLSAEWTNPQHEAPEPGSLALLCSAVVAAGAAALRRRQTA